MKSAEDMRKTDNPLTINTNEKEINMKTLIALFMMATLVITSGCWWTNKSEQGGIAPVDEGFSISIPSSSKIKQGETITIAVTLNRGDFFKRDVQLDIKSTEGLSVTPKSITVKASEKPEAKIQVTADRKAALGEYRITVKGTPSTGQSTSTESIFTVVSP